MQALLALLAAELAAPTHHVEAVTDVDLKEFAQAQGLRLAIDQCHVVDAEGLLHRREPVQLLQDGLGVEAVLELDDQAQTLVAVGEVLQVRDALELLGLHQFLDARDDLLGSDAVGQFGDDQAGAAGGHLLDGHGRPRLEGAAALAVGVTDAVQTDDGATGGQVGTGDELHELVQVRIGVGDEVAGGRDDLTEVVRGHVGGHADGDAAGAVDQEVGEGRGKDLGLGLLAVVVRFEVDDVLVDGGHQQLGGVVQTGLGVTHGRRSVVAAQGTEVAVAVDQGHTHGEGLTEPHESVVDGGVAMGVESAHHLPDHAGALDVSAVGPQTHLVHLVEDAPLNRLHAIACVR